MASERVKLPKYCSKTAMLVAGLHQPPSAGVESKAASHRFGSKRIFARGQADRRRSLRQRITLSHNAAAVAALHFKVQPDQRPPKFAAVPLSTVEDAHLT